MIFGEPSRPIFFSLEQQDRDVGSGLEWISFADLDQNKFRAKYSTIVQSEFITFSTRVSFYVKIYFIIVERHGSTTCHFRRLRRTKKKRSSCE